MKLIVLLNGDLIFAKGSLIVRLKMQILKWSIYCHSTYTSPSSGQGDSNMTLRNISVKGHLEATMNSLLPLKVQALIDFLGFWVQKVMA